jgi:hypothetical protein
MEGLRYPQNFKKTKYRRVMTYQLEEPFFEERGRITAQIEIGGHKTQMTFLANGTIKGNIEVFSTARAPL